MSSISYRADIDGLRAIAVLGVVFYHLGIGSFGGGFVGVDVFYVISGYLITGIIHREIVENRFTFAGFYERRVRRIFPALFAMLLATLLAGFWLLLPGDLVRLGQSTMATLLFGSNLLFSLRAGYFDSTSEINPLLHTWSLAVEEQFYLGLPVLLLLLQRKLPHYTRTIIAACAVVSFAACVTMQPLHPNAMFFLSPFRAWELLVGALLALDVAPPLRARLWREVIGAFALMVLLTSMVVLKADPEFPGWVAAIPVLATATLLQTGAGGDSLARRVLQLRPMVYVGLISYSLYLWHWPLLVAGRYLNDLSLDGSLRWSLLAASLALASLSYRFVERPFRRPRGTSSTPMATRRTRVFAASALLSVLVAGVASATFINHGWSFRVSAPVLVADAARSPVIPYLACDGVVPPLVGVDDRCTFGDPAGREDVLVWGDSYAMAWAPGLDAVFREHHLRGILATHSTCPPLFDVTNQGFFGCDRFNDAIRRWLSQRNVAFVMMIATWTAYSSPSGQYLVTDRAGRMGNAAVFPPAFAATIAQVRALVPKIVVIGPTPGAPSDVPIRFALAQRFAKPVPAPRSEDLFRRDAANFWSVAGNYAEDPRVRVVDPAPWFCDGRVCRYLSADDALLYRDGGHLSLVGARWAADHFDSLLWNGEHGAAVTPGAPVHASGSPQVRLETRRHPAQLWGHATRACASRESPCVVPVGRAE